MVAGLEEQFYAVWPAVLINLLRRRVRGSRLFVGLIIVAMGIWALRVGSGWVVLGCAISAGRPRSPPTRY